MLILRIHTEVCVMPVRPSYYFKDFCTVKLSKRSGGSETGFEDTPPILALSDKRISSTKFCI